MSPDFKKDKEEILEKNRIHYQNNKEKIKQLQRFVVQCECGCPIQRVSLTNHKKTKKHTKLMEELTI